MKVKYAFKKYEMPRRAKYFETGINYVLNPSSGIYGWERVEKETFVIGENDTMFVTELRESRNCDTWEHDYGTKCQLPIGFHKTRLLNWIPTAGEQMGLFD